MIVTDELKNKARQLWRDYHIEYRGSFGEFDNPKGMDIDDTGRLFVTDFGSASLKVFDINHNKIDELKLQPIRPIGVAADSAQKMLFLIDRASNTVAVIDYQGKITGRLSHRNGNIFNFIQPFKIKRGPEGNIWITDLCGHSIEKFSKSGIHQETIELTPEFELPCAITFGDHDRIYVTRYNYLTGSSRTRASCKNKPDKNNIAYINSSREITKFNLPMNSDRYLADITYDMNSFYLTDTKTLYKYDESFSPVYKLNLSQAFDSAMFCGNKFFFCMRVMKTKDKSYLYVIEISNYKKILVFEIT